jgi:hypothetical protein
MRDHDQPSPEATAAGLIIAALFDLLIDKKIISISDALGAIESAKVEANSAINPTYVRLLLDDMIAKFPRR